MAKLFGITLPTFQRASAENPRTSLANPAQWLTALFAPASKSGAKVSTESVISLTTVWRAVSVISQSIAALPFQVIEEAENGSVSIKKQHPSYHLLRYEPSQLYTSFNFMRSLVAQACFFGNAYAVIEINLDTSRPDRFTLIDQTKTSVNAYIMDGELMYNIDGMAKPIPASRMIHISNLGFNGLAGRDLKQVHKDNYGLAISARDFGNAFFANGTFLSGYLSTEKNLNLEARKKQAKSWSAAYSGTNNVGKIAVLDEGTEFKSMSIKPSDASMLETQKFSTQEVARIFGVPPHLLYDLDRSTYNNIEHLGQEFATYGLLPWLTQIEEEFSRKIFPMHEKRFTRTRNSRFLMRFDTAELLRADADSRSNLYQSGIQNGWMTPNEARNREGLNPVSGGDQNFIQLNMTTLDRVGQNTEQDAGLEQNI